MPRLRPLDYDLAPFLIIWETTLACGLACRHCRARAQPEPHPDELTPAEGKDLLHQAAGLGTPIVVLSGGDPLERRDLLDLVRSGASLGLRMATIPAATRLLTEAAIRDLKQAGLAQLALSLDFPDAGRHDRFRGVPGAFERTLQAAAWARREELPLQINTTLCAESAPYLEEMADFVQALGIVFWEVFFLVPMGRGAALGGLTAEQCEDLFAVLYRVQKRAACLVKVTEAPHYRRFVTQRERRECATEAPSNGIVRALPRQLTRTEGPGHSIGLATRAVNAGNGFLFVSHTGEILPSGFLPLSAGNIRRMTLSAAYRESNLFRGLRIPDRLRGICGICEYNVICGGSRSRAFALTGDCLQADPWCAYRPAAMSRS